MNILYEIIRKNVRTFMKTNIWTPRVFLIFFTFFERILHKSNCIIFIFSWCATHTKIRCKLVVTVTAGSQKITLWGPQRTPLGILRVNGNTQMVLGILRLLAWSSQLMKTTLATIWQCSYIPLQTLTELSSTNMITAKKKTRHYDRFISVLSCIISFRKIKFLSTKFRNSEKFRKPVLTNNTLHHLYVYLCRLSNTSYNPPTPSSLVYNYLWSLETRTRHDVWRNIIATNGPPPG